MNRVLIILLSVFAMLAVSGCGVWRGSKEIDTEPGGDGMGKGSGLITGKRGGIVIYQK